MATNSGLRRYMFGTCMLTPDHVSGAMHVEEKKLTSFTKTKKGVPHKGIELQGLGVAFYSLRQVFMSLPQLPLQAQNCCCVWCMLTARFAMFVYIMSVSEMRSIKPNHSLQLLFAAQRFRLRSNALIPSLYFPKSKHACACT